MINLRLKYLVKDLILPKDEVIFNIKKKHDFIIYIEKPNEEYLKKLNSQNSIFCTAEVKIEPNLNNLKIFDNIINNRIEKTPEIKSFMEFNLKGEKIFIPELNYFPAHFQDFIDQIMQELSDMIIQTIYKIRWICNTTGKHYPFSFSEFVFSKNSDIWIPVPTYTNFHIEEVKNMIYENKNFKNTMNMLFEKNIEEPIYHSIYREAWNLKFTNPRSSLIIVISSIEIAVKQLIIENVPKSQWLVENLQSPPIDRIFKEYINKLDVDFSINGKTLYPSANTFKTLKKWIGLRNKLIHLGKEEFEYGELQDFLLLIKDMLLIIDFYLGYKWSIYYLSERTLKEIGLEKKDIINFKI